PVSVGAAPAPGGGGGASSSGGGATTTTTTGTATVASTPTPSDTPPAPPPPTQPGEDNAIARGATVNGKPVPDGQVFTLVTGDVVDVSNGGAITMTNFSGGVATFSANQPATNSQLGPSSPSAGGSTQAGGPVS